LFIRAGAMIPMMLPAQRIPAGVVDPLILDVYPANGSDYVLHEDEGDTRFRLRGIPKGYSLAWSGPIVRQMVFRVHAGPWDAGMGVGRTIRRGEPAVAVRTLDDNTTEVRPLPAQQGTLALTTFTE